MEAIKYGIKKNESFLHILAQSYYKSMRFCNALPVYNEAIAISAQPSSDMYAERGAVLSQLNRNDEAIQSLEDAFRLYDKAKGKCPHWYYQEIGICKLKKGDFIGALSDLNMIKDCSLFDLKFCMAKCVALSQLEKYQELIDFAEHFSKLLRGKESKSDDDEKILKYLSEIIADSRQNIKCTSKLKEKERARLEAELLQEEERAKNKGKKGKESVDARGKGRGNKPVVASTPRPSITNSEPIASSSRGPLSEQIGDSPVLEQTKKVGSRLLCVKCNSESRQNLYLPCRHLQHCSICKINPGDICTYPGCEKVVEEVIRVFIT